MRSVLAPLKGDGHKAKSVLVKVRLHKDKYGRMSDSEAQTFGVEMRAARYCDWKIANEDDRLDAAQA